MMSFEDWLTPQEKKKPHHVHNEYDGTIHSVGWTNKCYLTLYGQCCSKKKERDARKVPSHVYARMCHTYFKLTFGRLE